MKNQNRKSNMQLHCLEVEYQVYSKKQKKNVKDLKRRLAEIRQMIEVMKVAARRDLFPSLNQTKLENCPRSLLISAINDDVSAKAVLLGIHLSYIGVERYEYLDNDKRLHVTFSTRQGAEFIFNHVRTFDERPLRIEWSWCLARKAAALLSALPNNPSSPRKDFSWKTPEAMEANAGAEDRSCLGYSDRLIFYLTILFLILLILILGLCIVLRKVFLITSDSFASLK